MLRNRTESVRIRRHRFDLLVARNIALLRSGGTGEDANKNEYCGHSQVIDYMGNSILEPQTVDGVFVVDINKETMLDTRQKFGFLNDRDHFLLV